MRKFTVLELFAGAGGMALGFEMAGLGTEALIEIDKDACATLKKNRPDWNVIHQDVAEVDFSKFKADIVAGGFPCQAFSYAGKGLGFEDNRGKLFFELARAVKEIKPKICVCENVEGLINHDDGRTLQTMIEVLTKLGYHVQMKVLIATDYSVAQKRKRIFLIGTLPGFHFTYPSPHEKKIVLRDALKDVPSSKGMTYSKKRYDVMKLVPPGGCWIHLPIEIQKEFMGASFYSGGGKRGMARRISWDEPCLTLTTSPSQKQTERCHPDETRPFTIREYARIQSFPDEWEFIGSISSSYRQIGNAVAVKVAEAVGKQIVHHLSNPLEKPDQIIPTIYTQTVDDKTKQTSLFENLQEDKEMFWINYEKRLEANIAGLLDRVQETQTKEINTADTLFELNKNTIDSFSTMIDVISSNKNFEEWINSEIERQRQKTLQNIVGEIQEVMIESIKPSIRKKEKAADRTRIYDLECEDEFWIAEVKNKFNTTKGDDKSSSFEKLEEGLARKNDSKWKAYYVMIIRPKHKKINNHFTPSDNKRKKKQKNERIFEIDGESFYEMLTGDKNGLKKAFDCLKNILLKRFETTLTQKDSQILDEIKEFTFFSKIININQATKTQLQYLPNIGEVAAEEIIKYRQENLFVNIDDVMNVRGIGLSTFQMIKDYIEV